MALEKARDGEARSLPLLVLAGFVVSLTFAFFMVDRQLWTWWPLSQVLVRSDSCPPDDLAPQTHILTIAVRQQGNLWAVAVWLVLLAASIALYFSAAPVARRLAALAVAFGSVALAISSTSWLEPGLLGAGVPSVVSCSPTSQELVAAAGFADYVRSAIPVALAMLLTAYLSLFETGDDARRSLRRPMRAFRTRWVVAGTLAVTSVALYLLAAAEVLSDEPENEALWLLILPVLLALVAVPAALVPNSRIRRVGGAASLLVLGVAFTHWASLRAIEVSHRAVSGTFDDPIVTSTLTDPQQTRIDQHQAALFALTVAMLWMLVCSAIIGRLLFNVTPQPTPPVVLLSGRTGPVTSWVDLQQKLWAVGCSTITRATHARHLAKRGVEVYELDFESDRLLVRRLGASSSDDRDVAERFGAVSTEDIVASFQETVSSARPR